MKKSAVWLAVLLLLPAAVFSQQVAEEELKIEARADFVNFEGRQREYPAQVIRDIGGSMSGQLLAGAPMGRYATKYTVVHVFDDSQPDLLGSDIVSFEPDARVNHINSVRLILTGFLESHYGYSRSQAEVLAVFTTHYNAVFRGNMEYFGGKYQGAVMQRLRPETAGLARHYEEWPGGTQILIPLTSKAARGEVRSVETSELTDEDVVEEIRDEEDKGVEDRRRMTELKEEQVEESEKEVEKGREELSEKESELTEREEKLREEKKATQRKEQQLEEERQELEEATDETEKREQEDHVASLEEEVDEEKDRQRREEERLAREREELRREEEDLEKEQQEIEEKKEEIAEEKQSIEQDEELLAKKEEIESDPERAAREMLEKEQALKEVAKREPIAAGTLYYMKVNRYLTDGHYANDLYRISASTGEFFSKAPERPHIAGHQYDVVPDRGVLVLTHGEGREAHYLTLLDLVSLEPLTLGETEIYHKSFIERRGGFIYAINFKDDTDFRLGKYDEETLELVAETRESIDKNTVFHMHESSIFVNRKDKRVLVLDAGDLTVRNLVDLP